MGDTGNVSPTSIDPDEPLPEQTGDESEVGWGEDLRGTRDDDPDDDTRFLENVPPHHGS